MFPIQNSWESFFLAVPLLISTDFLKYPFHFISNWDKNSVTYKLTYFVSVLTDFFSVLTDFFSVLMDMSKNQWRSTGGKSYVKSNL